MTDQFTIDWGVLQEDHLAPFLFIISLHYVLRYANTDLDDLTLVCLRSQCYPAEVLADLHYADDIALGFFFLENTIETAQYLFRDVDNACQNVGPIPKGTLRPNTWT